jgi:hypothetical protein
VTVLPSSSFGVVTDPLPHLRAADFGSGGVFHQVVDRDATVAANPRRQILQSDVNSRST